MKIAFCGAGGTGKTTVMNIIGGKLDIPTMKSSSRTIYEEHGLTEELVSKFGPQRAWKLQKDIFDRKMNNDLMTDYFIADRSLLDHFAYCIMYCSHIMTDAQFSKIENLTFLHMRTTYDLLAFFPHGVLPTSIENDGVRNCSMAWQSAIDAIIRGYLSKWELSYMVMQTANLDTRVEFIEQYIKTDFFAPTIH